MLYCVLDSYGDIIGRFKSYEQAIDYVNYLSNSNIKDVTIKKMTKTEYLKYMRELIDNCK